MSSVSEFSYSTAFSRSALAGEPGGTGAGITNQEIVDFKLYPNPSDGNEITLQLDGTFSYSIMDASGKVITTNNGNNLVVISLQDFEKGIYFVQVTQADATTTERLIIK